jgi:predicted ATP-dependent serine protease
MGKKKNTLLDVLENIPNPPKLSPLLNRQIDRVLHKAAERNRSLYIIDSLAHTAVEAADSVALSVAKSIRYNLRRIIEGEGGGEE